jgi:putative inorganic carbon (HCO3(-)) transporter
VTSPTVPAAPVVGARGGGWPRPPAIAVAGRGRLLQAAVGAVFGAVVGIAIPVAGLRGVAVATGAGLVLVAGMACLSSRAATAFVLAGAGFTYAVDAVQPSGLPALVPALALVALLVGGQRWSTGGERRRFIRASAVIGVYGLVLLASSFVADDRDVTFAVVTEFVQVALVVAALVVLVRDRDGLRAAVWGIVLAGGGVAAISVVQYVTGSYGSSFFGLAHAARMNIVGEIDDFRIAGTLEDPNFFAQMMVVVVPLGIERARNEHHTGARALAAVCASLAGLAMLFTSSRGGLIGLAVGVLLALRLAGATWWSLAAVAVAGAIAGVVLFPNAARRVAELQDISEVSSSESADPALRGRTSEMLAAVLMFRDRPVLGVGAGNYPHRYAEYALPLGLDTREERSAHSMPLNVAAETGVVGVVSFGAVLGLAGARLGTARRRLVQAGFGTDAELVAALRIGFVVFLVCSLPLHLSYPRMVWVLVALALASTSVAAAAIRSDPTVSR